MTPAASLNGGFADPARDAARAFRAAMEVMARPGLIRQVTGATPPAPLSPAAGALLLTLADPTTPVCLAPSHDTPAIRAWIAFHCGAPLCAAPEATFALGTWAALAPFDRFPLGTPEYPDRSVTLIVECDRLANDGARLTGPGIDGHALLSLPEAAAFRANHRLAPLGFDTYLACGNRLAALPRSTRVEGAA